MTSLYEVLEISADATQIEIKRAYRKLALRWHPDKVSDEGVREESELKFKEISAAYEVLGDEERRAHYDTYGDEQSSAGFGSGFHDQFNDDAFMNFFHNFNMDSEMPGDAGAAGAAGAQALSSPDVEVPLEVSMADSYNGKSFKFRSSRKIVCDRCEGSGWRRRNGHLVAPPIVTCKKCGGRGYKQRIRSIAPGFATSENIKCIHCSGLGKYPARPNTEKSKCKKCQGVGLVTESKVLSVSIPRGSKNGDRIVLPNEADEALGKSEAGDLVFVVKEGTECPEGVDLQRCGFDMITHLTISLAEAITGFNKILTRTLDGRVLKLKIPPGKVIRPGEFIKIKNEGWPSNENATKFGDIYVIIHIEFPPDNWFSEKGDLLQVKNILPGSSMQNGYSEDPYNTECVTDIHIIRELPDTITKNVKPKADERRSEDFTSSQCSQQ
ncbi:hypothetical protein HG535_0G04420 [Zygotorulaspora mrakii]|uniref:J domain-containing protein n=1 Tax=Zygotorulaspora mrakii TaxID=42260 RepID=A0A7H9B976_ZYGMR|nr:uncharacterized protein HG535_0G04420 [Zygotorulaspora mrakii]QLG74559.1 hypothetical protein HG535_0G04420 [Zygotorulaspora mrakii]